ncbi:MAG: hypothetical protein ABI553_03185 [Chloroflexota bacterium]
MEPKTTVRPGSIGGAPVVGSSVLLVVALAIAATGGSVGLGAGTNGPGVGGLILIGAIVLGSLGAGIIGLSGPAPLRGRAVRIGLCALALGLAGIVSSSVIAMGLTFDPLENGPFVILFLVGGLGIMVGVPLTLVSLLLMPRWPRRIAGFFVIGLLLDMAAGNILGSLGSQAFLIAGMAMSLVGTGSMILAVAGIGRLVIEGSRAATPATA